LDTNFVGGTANWPGYEVVAPQDLYKWAFSGTATTDNLGRIILTSSRDPLSPEDQPFAFVNALVVEPKGVYVPLLYACCPVPFDDAEDAPVDVVLSWSKGGLSETHDVYFGTNEAHVTDANRSNPLGVLVSQDHPTIAYNPAGLLDLDTTYYWRVDEVNSAPDYTIFKGETWSFTTLTYFVMEDFDSYEDDTALRDVWQDSGTGAEVSVETAVVRAGNSMRYEYKNNLPPYYSEVRTGIADLGIDDPNWSALGAQTLVLYFYGEPANPLGEQMYVKLTDGDSPTHTATVTYSNMNDVRLKQWNKWSIPLTEFAGVNLANVASISIGFGDGSPGNAGIVYFEDITLDSAEAEILPEVTGTVDVNTRYQMIEGFGASGAWYENYLTTNTQREAIYDLIFNDLSIDIYRIRNTYDYDAAYMNRTATIVSEGLERNPNLKIMVSSWSPPTYLKSTGRLDEGTLIGGLGNYAYDGFAQWWYDSIVAWSALGVNPYYINIQNEPDWNGNDRCLFQPTESAQQAGYDQAFETVWQKLYSEMGSAMPKMLATDHSGLQGANGFTPDQYLNALPDLSHVYGYAHHLYNCSNGPPAGCGDEPDLYIPFMSAFYSNWNDKPLMQTEYEHSTGVWPDALNVAWLLHNSLTIENVSVYLYWDLFWPTNALITIPSPSGSTYTLTSDYYGFKHFSGFVHQGWQRVGASTSLGNLGNLRVSAFKSPDNQQLSIVIINLAYQAYNLTLNVEGFQSDSSAIYRTSETERMAYIGPFYQEGMLMLPERSIVTIHGSTVPLNCAGALDMGYRLASDLDPDCYVNYNDLKIITDYWLNPECTLLDDCEGADFGPTDGVVDLLDLSRFAEQWLWCNDPQDPNCSPNW
jgi:glucuronoarabinoxylan endo-1,4-beta-xylanase